MTSISTKKNIEAVYPLSPMQEGMLFHSLLSPEEGYYFERFTCTFRGNLNVPAFIDAWKEIVKRHPILRTAFVWKRLENMVQVVHRHVEIPFEHLDWRDDPPEIQENKLKQYLEFQTQQGFDLAKAPLIRLALIRTGDDVYYFVWCYHHSLLDGWSQPILIKELTTLYESYSENSPVNLNPIQPFRTYIEWLKNQDEEKAERFWRTNLKGFTSPTPIEVNSKSLIEDKGVEHKELGRAIPKSITSKLLSFASEHQITINTIVLGAWSILLSRYTDSRDVLFGVTVSGRPPNLKGSNQMVGLFINTLPMRVQIPNDFPVYSWLKNLQTQQLEMRKYEHSPLVKIQEWSDVPSGSTLFENIFVFENYPVQAIETIRKPNLSIENVEVTEKANYPLTLVAALGEELYVKFAFDCGKFDEFTIERMLAHLVTILEDFASFPEKSIISLEMLTSKERGQILQEWTNTKAQFPEHQCIHQLFEIQSSEKPNKIALNAYGDEITYKELDNQANKLAHYLRSLGVGSESLVGVFLDRSLAFIISVLGILKAGGAYVPLDIGYPQKRLDFMLSDTNARLVLTEKRFLGKLPNYEGLILSLDDDEIQEKIKQLPDNAVENTTRPDQPAYIIFTSGSTGKPKGVVLGHRGLVNLVLSQIDAFSILPDDRVLQFASISFDASISEIFTTLISGATLYLTPQEISSSPIELADFLKSNEISVATLPPSLLMVMPSNNLPSLKTLISAGEICPWEVFHRWSSVPRFLNAYGPTEATIGPTYYHALTDNQELQVESKSVPIGRPIKNMQIYILDHQMHPVPVGVTGEIYIAGVGLAHGYLNRPDLTSEKFVQYSFTGSKSIRLYKTGDLARYLSDGNIEFVGRIDDQVSIRGYRVELGEIEVAISQHSNIQNAVVLAHKNGSGDTKLIAYLISDDGETQNISEIRDYLISRLPTYMIPNLYVVLEAFPMTASGKVDRKALLKLEGIQTGLEENYKAPQTPHQELLAGIFSHVLDINSVGINDNFFELGGHSLLVTKLVSKIRKAFQVEIDLRDVFENPTINSLARIIQEVNLEDKTSPPPIYPKDLEGDLPLSFAQQRLWFLDQLLPENAFYNIPIALNLDGALDIIALENALNTIIKRHDILRTIFTLKNNEPVQNVLPELLISIPIIDLSEPTKNPQEIEVENLAIIEAQKPFNLAKGPLIRAQILKLADTNHVILFTLHHIIADGWSMQILVNELAALYKAFMNDEPSPLAPLSIQYTDFTLWQREWLQGAVLEEQKDYWKSQLADSQPILDIPTDRPRPVVPSSKGAHFGFQLSPELSSSLVDMSQHEGVTLFMLLLSAFMTLLYRYTDQTDINVGTPIANRTRDEIEGLIGFFVNTLVMRGDLSGNPSFRVFLHRIREMAFDAYSHQDLPFETLVETLQPVRDMTHSPLFQVMFALDNNSTENLKLPGLTLSPLVTESGTSKFDLTLQIQDQKEFLAGNIEYNSDLFDRSTIERFIDHFQNLLLGIIEDPNQRISELPIFSSKELEKILISWNDTRIPVETDLCIHEIFEKWVEQIPKAIAVDYSGDTITYSAINAKANQIARFLQAEGVGPETLVSVCLDKSIDLIICLLGIWKAGGVYLPLDPDYPQGRLSYMISDSNVAKLISQEKYLDRFKKLSLPVTTIEQLKDQSNKFADNNLNTDVHPQNLAYVIYTSGSTGMPKGVQLPHAGLCNVVKTQQAKFGVGPGDRVLQFSSLSFDAAMFEMVMGFGTGGTLCMGSREEMRPGRELLDFMLQTKPSIIVFPPSALKVLPKTEIPSLRIITVAGEACPAELVDRWSNGRQFFNLYGPTEDTIWTTAALCKAKNTKPLIGKPINNHQAYILDSYGNPVPVGSSGELHLGGIGTARGYLGKAKLTADRFVPNPQGDGDRLYKTGDVARFLPDGNIDFLGRRDDQVKVHGYRIELGEIENALKQSPTIKETSVVIHTDESGEPIIVAYFVPENEHTGKTPELRKYLEEHLPKYMIPSVFMALETLPLLPSGKVNRKELPIPEIDRTETKTKFIHPRNQLEETLVSMWQKIIRVDQIGVNDNFFELGGDSIRGAVFINQLEKVIGESIYVAALFEAQTIAELAAYLLENYPDAVSTKLGAEPTLVSELEKISAHDGSWQPSSSIHPAIVPIQTNGSKTPLFCLHAAGGVVFPYYNLVPYLGEDQPLYGVQRPTNVKIDEKFSNLRELASYYIEGLQAVQPHGPYSLAGWSSGGVVAFEMAQQLIKIGEKVSFLGIIDFKAPKQPDEIKRIRRIRRIRGQFKFGRFRMVKRFFRTLPHFIKEFFVLLKSALSFTRDGLWIKFSKPKTNDVQPTPSQEKPSFGEYVKWIWISAMRNNVLGKPKISSVMSRNSDLMLIELPTVRHTIGRVGKDIRLAKMYIPDIYPGSLTLFDAGSFQEEDDDFADPTMGWGQLTEGKVRIKKIVGNHISVLTQPYVEPFANILKESIEEAIKDN